MDYLRKGLQITKRIKNRTEQNRTEQNRTIHKQIQ